MAAALVWQECMVLAFILAFVLCFLTFIFAIVEGLNDWFLPGITTFATLISAAAVYINPYPHEGDRLWVPVVCAMIIIGVWCAYKLIGKPNVHNK